MFVNTGGSNVRIFSNYIVAFWLGEEVSIIDFLTICGLLTIVNSS